MFDLDITGAYPSFTDMCNISRETNVTNVISMEGVSIIDTKMLNLGLVFGNVNDVDYCSSIHNTDTLLSLVNRLK